MVTLYHDHEALSSPEIIIQLGEQVAKMNQWCFLIVFVLSYGIL